MNRVPRSGTTDRVTRYRRICMSAGRTVKENAQAAAIPTAVTFPRCQNGGESEKFSARKPMIVVNDVMLTGMKFRRNASTIASVFADPSRIAVRSEVRM